MKNIVVLTILASLLTGCGTPEFNQEAYDAAYANKCNSGVGSPVEPWDFYKKSDAWQDSYYYLKETLECK